MPPSLSNRLDLDVYQVVKRLEQNSNDGKLFKTVSAAYTAVKASNSSLSRQKKRPLEDALFRVLDLRKQEEADESDSEAAIDVEDPNEKSDERFLLNRQMTRHWNVEPATMPAATTNGEQPAKKKRRVDVAQGDERNPTAMSTPKELTEGKTVDHSKLQKKTPRGPLFDVESHVDRPILGGLGKAYNSLLFDLENLLVVPQCYDPRDERLLGILLTGPSGVGKSSYIRSFAAHMGIALINMTRCFDEPERIDKSLAEAFDVALASAPSILYVEHIEHFLPKTSDASQNEQQHLRTLSLFKRQMGRVKAQKAPVVCIATAAREADVNMTLLTGGWFDVRVQLSVPNIKQREDILRAVIDQRAVDDQLDLASLAKKMDGFVGGDIAQVVRHAVRNAAGRSRSTYYPNPDKTIYDDDNDDDDDDSVAATRDSVPLTLADFAAALDDYVPVLRMEGFTAVPDVTWDQVGGLAPVRAQLQLSIVGPIANPALYAHYGLTRAGGCLLWGPPGCGKTLVAQAVANEAQASFILINGPELLNKYVGESERAVRELFSRARSSTPCILFFDEFDSIAPRRDGGGASEAGTRVVNALLTELDGARGRDGVYVIGTTNRPDMIDDAMLRPGRLSKQLFLDLPTPAERVDILRAIYRTRHVGATDAEFARLDRIARDERCEGFSGADLSGLHEHAAEFAITRYLQTGDYSAPMGEISEQDWEAALRITRPSVTKPEVYRKLRAKLAGGV